MSLTQSSQESFGESTQRSEITHLLSKTEPHVQKNKPTHVNGKAGNGWSASAGNHTSNKEASETGDVDQAQVSRLTRRRRLTLLLLCVANICAGCSFSMLAPFYPNEAKKKGISDTVIGFVFSSFQIINFTSALIYGSFMIRIGPKFLFVTGIFTAGAASIIFGLLDRSAPGATFLALSVVCRCFEAGGVSAFITSGLAVTVNEFPEHVATVFGAMESGVAIGLMIGPAIGGVLNEVGGFGLPFYVIGALIFLTGLVACMFLPPPQGVVQRQGTNMLVLLRSPLVLVGLQFVLVTFAGVTFLEPILSTYLLQFQLSPSVIGAVFIIIPVLQSLSTVWGYLADKKNITQVPFIGGSLVCSVGYLVIGPTPVLPFLPVKLWVVILGLVMFGLGVGFAFVAPVKCIVQGARELGFEYNLSVFGMVSGLFCATINIGAFVGPSVAGLLAQSIGFRWATTAMSGIFILSTFCTISYFSIRYINIRRREKVLQEHNETKEMYSLELGESNMALMPLVQKQ